MSRRTYEAWSGLLDSVALALVIVFACGAWAEPIGPSDCVNNSYFGVQYTLEYELIDEPAEGLGELPISSPTRSRRGESNADRAGVGRSDCAAHAGI